MTGTSPLRVLEPLNRPSVADTVFDELHRQILSLEHNWSPHCLDISPSEMITCRRATNETCIRVLHEGEWLRNGRAGGWAAAGRAARRLPGDPP